MYKAIFRIAWVIAFVIVVFSLIGEAFAGASDIENHWAQKKIQKWVNVGLISGYPDGTFKPDQNISRAEFITLVNKVFSKYDKEAACNFADVKNKDWFYGQVASAKEAGYIYGYADNNFRPGAFVNRQEAAVMLTRLLGCKAESQLYTEDFDDREAISIWSENSVSSVVYQKIMLGYPDNTFRPLIPLTRAQAVTALDKSLAILRGRNSVTY